MKKISVLVLILLLTSVSSVYALHEPEIPKEAPKITGSVSVSIMSDFVARGRKLGGEPAIQPSLTLNYDALSFTYWQNNDWDDDSRPQESAAGQGHATESDLIVTYYKQVHEKVGVVAGVLYIAGHGFADTTRWIGGVTFNTLLSPSLTVYWDTDEGDGTFYVASISHSFQIPVGDQKIPLNLSAQASYDDGDLYASTDDDGKVIHDFHYGQVTASTSLPIFKLLKVDSPVLQGIFLAPNINYSFPLSSKGKEVIENGSINNESRILYGGVTVGLSF